MISRRLVRLLALACGVTIANVYYPQPLLHTIARDLGASQSAASFIVTATQFGFAAGLVFVVPLGDIVCAAAAGFSAVALLGWLAAARYERAGVPAGVAGP